MMTQLHSRYIHILVPLDNESVHDKALPTAEALAKAYGAELNILCVIPTLARSPARRLQ